ncbi:MAG: bifunctional 3,4-dihydroxy-2-butanone-4-phosphate synthase/GTP cyclohydrolase II [Elusimicrobiota bacterium]|jgi:3,4-dihydroxy 2-butanone 4-phosphate synthase/GTP cyclohydrolase II|nr:bifunctional 3,4-dihydroxy-2-butanone-4-phosphate synthase/GTP cyclohydrolase II [Elusimicrobiota bacterium]
MSIEKAIQDIKAGKMVIVVDDEKRENEGDLVCAAQKVTPEIINFMTKFGRGLVCAPLESKRLDELLIDDMVIKNTENTGCCFTVSVDYKFNTTTGISAYDRALTIQKLVDKKSKPQDFLRPGHIFPLRARDGGVLERAGHTEAAVDLAKLAGLYPAGVICEIMSDDGGMAKLNELEKFAKKYKMEIVKIDQLIAYRMMHENVVTQVQKVNFPTDFGIFKLAVFENNITKENALAIIKGNISGKENVLARIHSSCETGDIFHSQRCDCGDQLGGALKKIDQKGEGVLLYLHQEGRGIGLVNKIKAYALQEKGYDTVDANVKLGFDKDLRDYFFASQIFKLLKVKSLDLMTNNPAKIEGLKKYGIKVSKRTELEIAPKSSNEKYMKTKKEKMGHMLKKI